MIITENWSYPSYQRSCGVDTDALMAGAARMMDICAEEAYQNPAWRYAAIRYELYRSGKSIELMACYDPAFRFMAEWWKQLFGESEGKEGKGLFPASVEFTADLHSMKMLRSRLMELKAQQHAEKISDIKGVQMKIEWGSQIRSYVFMPYTLAKDTRTGYEMGNISAVMDGDIDGFINAYLTGLATGELKK